MKYALNREDSLVLATPGAEARCPVCRERVHSKCGELLTWHWSHEATLDCDPWFEPETVWHRNWKSYADPERVEVPMQQHRADIVSRDQTVVELQHSPIGPEEVRERENFYGRMVWLIDGSPFEGNFRVTLEGSACRFVWVHARPSWLASISPKFIHGFALGRYVRQVVPPIKRPQWVWTESGRSESIFQIRSMQSDRFVHGTGRIIETDRFIKQLIA